MPATGLLMILFAAGMFAAVALGPLGLHFIRQHIGRTMHHQLLGSEAVVLFVAVPMATYAAILWVTHRPVAAPLTLGTALFATYTYLTYIVLPDHARYPGNGEKAFPLYLGLFVIGWVATVRAWTSLPEEPVWPAPWIRLSLAVVLGVLALFFLVTWYKQVVDVIRGGSGPMDFREHPSGFWLIRLLDLGLIVPLLLIASLGLWQRAPLALKLAYALAPFVTALVAAVIAMAVVMIRKKDPGADRTFLYVLVPVEVVLAVLSVSLLLSFE